MNNASLYSASNDLPTKDAKYIIDSYFENIKWLPNGGDLSLDIGCGNGEVTKELLLKTMPNNIGMLIGTDISQKMIEYASTTYQNQKLKFQQLDIGAKYLPKPFIEKFDHVFSFYCLHWLQDQRQAFQNIYDLLKPNGDIIVTYLAKSVIFSAYESISKIEKWKPYMLDYNKYVSPFQKSMAPEKELKQILKSIGFEVGLCKSEPRTYVFEDVNTWRNCIQSVNVFVDRMPESLIEEFIDEFMVQYDKRGLVHNINNKIHVSTPYELMVVYAKKL